MFMGLPYRLALDLGTNSIGWCMLRLDMSATPSPAPVAVIRAGVRIFGDGRDPQSGASLAVSRRDARAMRRNRDRKLARKRRVIDALVQTGLFPGDPADRRALESFDPYVLRATGLDRELPPHEFGRALFHLNQRRGFQSNRKTDGDDSDGSLMKTAIKDVRTALAANGYRTIGEWLAARHAERATVRARLRGTTARDKHYDLYFDRAMIRHEFDTLWDAQHGFNPEYYTQAKRDAIAEVLFYQRNLRPVRAGRCSFEPDRERAARALPSVHRLRIYQEVNNLGIDSGTFTYTPLTRDQRDLIVNKLEHQKTLSFDAIRRALKLEGSPKFNLESAKRKDLKGNATSYLLGQDEHVGSTWFSLSAQDQDHIVERILEDEDEEKLCAWLTETHGLTDEAALATAGTRTALTKLSPGYGRLSKEATTRILPHLASDVVTFDKAVVAAGYASHSALTHTAQTGEILSELPYYGQYLQRHVGHGTGLATDLPADRYGRIANPTVHIALNEVRKVVNELIAEYGAPEQVIVEVVRDLKLTADKKADIAKDQAARQTENEAYRAQIKSLTGIDASRPDIQKMRLWVELNPSDPLERRCPYTGEQISIARLFSPEVEIEHILPFSMTLDDSMNNKTVAVTRANRDKGNRTPFDAFGESPAGYDYEAILDRAHLMPKGKAYRFGPDGYARWLRDDKDFLARALNDTAYLSRIAKEYLELIAPGQVWVVPGRLTGALRRHWGLNGILHDDAEKNRADHRHHAIDAVVLGMMDRASLAQYAKASGRGSSVDDDVAKRASMEPLKDFRARVSAVIGSIIVSHRPNHGHQRQMNNDTNYGLRKDGIVATRKPLDGFASPAAIESATFADPALQERLLRHVGSTTGTEFKTRIASFAQEHRTRRARLLERLGVIAIPAPANAMHRSPARSKARDDNSARGVKGDSNYCIEIYTAPNGKWKGDVITTYEAYRIAAEHGDEQLRDPRQTQSGKPLVMRLMRDDIVAVTIDSERQLMRLCQFKAAGQMSFIGLTEANADARVRAGEITYLSKSPGALRDLNAVKVTVSPAGRAKAHRLPR